MLVLVTLICLYLGWAMNWIRQRQEYRHLHEIEFIVGYFPAPPKQAPWPLRLLGESGVYCVWPMRATEAEAIAISVLFPEAQVFVTEPRQVGFIYSYRNGERFREPFP